MKLKNYRTSLILLTILVLTILSFVTVEQKHNINEETQRVLPDLSKITDDAQLAIPKKEESEKENTGPVKVEKVHANLDDVAKASTPSFPVMHQFRDGCEWITSDLEDYPVLYQSTPLLRNLDIRGVQQTLLQLDYYHGEVDGIYGPNTIAAVKRFQLFYGLEPTGIVDLDDYDLLASVYEETVPALAKAKPSGKVSLLIVLDERILYVLEDGEIFHIFPVAVGKIDTPSPIGSWKIITKASWGGGFGTRWMGLNVPYGKYGIHGTNKPWSISGPESAGCIRMFNRDVETLYSWVTWGTRVNIVGGDFPYNVPWRTIKNGHRGSDVWIVQNRLKEMGYQKWNPDGVYGTGTENLIKKLQKNRKLPVTGEVDWATRQALGLYYFQ